MTVRARHPQGARGYTRLHDDFHLPRPTLQLRLHAWRVFQRALDPLGPSKPLRKRH